MPSQTRSPRCWSGTNWSGGDAIFDNDLVFSKPIALPSGVGASVASDPGSTMILGCFGFTIPTDANITAVEVTSFIIKQGSTATVLKVHETLDGATPSTDFHTINIPAGSAVADYATFDVPLPEPTVSQANDSDFGVILKMDQPPFGSTPIGIDYLAITITYDLAEEILTPPVLTGDTTSDTTATLTWTEVEDATEYELFDITSGTAVSLYSGALLEFDLTGLTPGETTTYYVVASNDDLSSLPSNEVDITPAIVPSDDIGWVGVRQHERVTRYDPVPVGYVPSAMYIEWVPLEGADSYDLQRREVDTEEWFDVVLATPGPSYINTGIYVHGDFEYRVRARTGTAVGEWNTPRSGRMSIIHDPVWNARRAQDKGEGLLDDEIPERYR